VLTNSDHEDFARPHHVDNTVGVPKDLQHHLLLILGGGPVLGMRAGVDNAVHIQVQIVEFLAVRVRFGSIDGDNSAVV